MLWLPAVTSMTAKDRAMNTANLGLEGLYLAIASVNALLVEKGMLTHAEVDAALKQAEAAAMAGGEHDDLSGANRKAICFPIRFLMLANEKGENRQPVRFRGVAEDIGRRW
jgi:hypothetical protein